MAAADTRLSASEAATIDVLPARTAETLPLGDTVATLRLALVHRTPVGDPWGSTAVALSVSEAPGATPDQPFQRDRLPRASMWMYGLA